MYRFALVKQLHVQCVPQSQTPAECNVFFILYKDGPMVFVLITVSLPVSHTWIMYVFKPLVGGTFS